MSLGMATTSVPPALGVPLPVDADGSTDGCGRWRGRRRRGRRWRPPSGLYWWWLLRRPRTRSRSRRRAHRCALVSCFLLLQLDRLSPPSMRTRQRRAIRTRHRIAWAFDRRIRPESTGASPSSRARRSASDLLTPMFGSSAERPSVVSDLGPLPGHVGEGRGREGRDLFLGRSLLRRPTRARRGPMPACRAGRARRRCGRSRRRS